ncbi:MAG: hypothetical protein KDA80_03765, partial [Planctomycetaceae bacterium]|nr:hypothetical protein [Planctomycetaceae bacterium]
EQELIEFVGERDRTRQRRAAPMVVSDSPVPSQEPTSPPDEEPTETVVDETPTSEEGAVASDADVSQEEQED